MSQGWKRLEEDGNRYMKSFDPRVPPSLFISQRDATRHNMPMPLVERCIEDYNDDDVLVDHQPLTVADIEAGGPNADKTGGQRT